MPPLCGAVLRRGFARTPYVLIRETIGPGAQPPGAFLLDAGPLPDFTELDGDLIERVADVAAVCREPRTLTQRHSAPLKKKTLAALGRDARERAGWVRSWGVGHSIRPRDQRLASASVS